MRACRELLCCERCDLRCGLCCEEPCDLRCDLPADVARLLVEAVEDLRPLPLASVFLPLLVLPALAPLPLAAPLLLERLVVRVRADADCPLRCPLLPLVDWRDEADLREPEFWRARAPLADPVCPFVPSFRR